MDQFPQDFPGHRLGENLLTFLAETFLSFLEVPRAFPGSGSHQSFANIHVWSLSLSFSFSYSHMGERHKAIRHRGTKWFC